MKTTSKRNLNKAWDLLLEVMNTYDPGLTEADRKRLGAMCENLAHLIIEMKLRELNIEGERKHEEPMV